jgi:nitrous oxidase accessory protein NosD
MTNKFLLSLLVSFVWVIGLAVEPAAAAKVNCDKGQSIQQKLDDAKDGDRIEVTGTCIEDIVISKSRLTLDCGAPANASIIGTGGSTQTIQIQGLNVTVSNCTISGAGNLLGAVVITRNGSATIEANTIVAGTGANGSGVGVAQNSYGRILNNDITGGVNGVIVTSGSMADLFQNDITGATVGIVVINSAAADLVKNVVTGLGISSTSLGVFVSRTSTVNFSNDVIFGNDPNTFQANAVGIACSALSVLRFGLPPGVVVLQLPGTGNSQNTNFQPFSSGGCVVQGTAF